MKRNQVVTTAALFAMLSGGSIAGAADLTQDQPAAADLSNQTYKASSTALPDTPGATRDEDLRYSPNNPARNYPGDIIDNMTGTRPYGTTPRVLSTTGDNDGPSLGWLGLLGLFGLRGLIRRRSKA